LARALGIGRLRSSDIVVEWPEPSAERAVTTLPGRIPIQGRSVTVDMSQLDPGDYTLLVRIARADKNGGGAASASAAFRIVPP
jgi:hypothetical protein